ncbi:MAG: alcohol dehydrogenase family protein [Desulfobacteraceae bacterium]|jgi:NADPH:quinone reductase-like Zn-dependent oxidoreductase
MKPDKMKAVLLTGFGGYEKLDYREDVAVPIPGHGEVLIKVGACGVNNTDIWTREGVYGEDNQAGWQGADIDFPRIQGADIVGHILEVGEGVPQSRVGERVLVNPTLYKKDEQEPVYAGFMGSERDGSFAEYVCVPLVNVHTVDSPLSDEQLATFMCSYLTAEHMLNRARLKTGETVLVTGASGGVGSGLVQLAKIRGALVIALVGKGKEDKLRKLRIDGVITRGQTDIYSAVMKIAGKSLVDVVADVVAGPLIPDLLNVLRPGGRYVTAGAIAGPIVEVDWRKIYLKQLDLFGSTLGTQQEAKALVEYITTGQLTPLLAGTYPLNQLVEAQKDFKRKQFFGKLVIVP